MGKTKIEWCDFTINPVKGLCPQGCHYCYARKLYKRFGWNRDVRFDINSLIPAWLTRESLPPSRIFVGSTMELFGPWVSEAWMRVILRLVGNMDKHTFIFLTKRPRELRKFNPWPDNAWVGYSAIGMVGYTEGLEDMGWVEAKVRFCSLEPMLMSPLPLYGLGQLDWLIAGLRTQPLKKVPETWIRGVIATAEETGTPLFLKDSIHNAYVGMPAKREFPKL